MSDSIRRINELAIQYYGNNVENDPETGLLETLSALASLEQSEEQVCDAPLTLQRIWDNLCTSSTSCNAEAASDVWETASLLTAALVRRLTPFDVHLHALNALLFSDQDSNEARTDIFSAFCLLHCSWSLRQMPPSADATSAPKRPRYKRWQSILCGTVRLFQQYRQFDWEVSLWINFVLPSCHYIKLQLPQEATHVGIAAGLIGTTLNLMEAHPLEVNALRRALATAEMKKPTLDDILGHPWAVASFLQQEKVRTSVEDEQEEEDDSAYDVYRDSLAWWTERAYCHDAVSSMDTSWSKIGLALLACDISLNHDDDNRNSNSNTNDAVTEQKSEWDLLFPHVNNLLLDENSQRLGLEFVQKLLTKPEKSDSMTAVKSPGLLVQWKNVPTNPTGTLQLLSNHLIAASQRQDQSAATTVSNLMQQLVQKYVASSQVEMVSLLIYKCPYPSLGPKLLDLLRSLVVREIATTTTIQKPLWRYLEQDYLISLLRDYVNSTTIRLQQIDKLLDRSESYVSAVNMVHLHLLLNDGAMPMMEMITPEMFEMLLAALNKIVIDDDWAGEEIPRNFHRLFLLQSTLSATVDLVRSPRRCKT